MVSFLLWLLDAGGVQLVLYALYLGYSWCDLIRRGMRIRTRLPFCVLAEGDSLEIVDGRRYRQIDVRDIARARYARCDDDGEWLLDNALTVFDANGRKLAKIPESAHGFGDVRRLLAARTVPVDVVDVDP